MNMDLAETIEPRSDQQNFDDYLAGPRTVTISAVTKGSPEQPVAIELAEYPGRPYKPNKSMRRVLVLAWGSDSSVYVGRRLKLRGNPDVLWGGKPVGGIEIEAMSHIEKPLTASLTVKRGSRAPYVVQPLATEAPKQDPGKPIEERRVASVQAFARLNVPLSQLEEHLNKAVQHWTVADLLDLANVYTSITKDGAPVNQYFTTEADR